MSDKPIRIQRKRTKGWRMPANTVYVGRPSRWGNLFRREECGGSKNAVASYEIFMTPTFRAEAKAKLKGKNLACWCRPGQICHADVLLELANKP